MKEHVLPKTGGKVRIGVLDGACLAEVLALHETARASLPADKKNFILPQTPAYFQNLLTGATGLMIGIHNEAGLIAHMALMGPMELREAIALHLITDNDVPFHHAALTDSVMVFKSLTVNPDWRGNDLASTLIAFASEQPFAQKSDHLFAQISVGNRRSWNVFARQKFGIVAAANDPTDKQPRFIFQKPAFGFDFAPAIIADEVDPVSDFSAIVNLTQREALVGVAGEEPSSPLMFLRSREVLNLLPTVARFQTHK